MKQTRTMNRLQDYIEALEGGLAQQKKIKQLLIHRREGISGAHSSISLWILAFTSLKVIAPERIFNGLPGLPGLFLASASASSNLAEEGDGGAPEEEPEAIWSHSSPSRVIDVRKSGHRDERRRRDSVASALYTAVSCNFSRIEDKREHTSVERRPGRLDDNPDDLFDGNGPSATCGRSWVRGGTLRGTGEQPEKSEKSRLLVRYTWNQSER